LIKSGKTNILLIVQNNSFPFDKRVYKEARSLQNAGYNVTVICPRSPLDTSKKEIVDGIEVYRYKNLLSDGSVLGYIKEFAWSSAFIYFLFLRHHLFKHFKVVHTANPPDLFWGIAIICRLTGAKFIFDQHDLSPETYENKYGRGFPYKILLLNEYLSVLFSNHIITVNESCKNRSIKKWGDRKKYTVIYNGPHGSFEAVKNNELIKKYSGKKVVLFVGLMTKNDNIEVIIDAADIIINKDKRKDIMFILLGTGDVLDDMKQAARKRGLENYIEFTGLVDYKKVMEYLYIADACISPDLPSELNNYVTLVKALEYMKAGKAFVSFRLQETMLMAAETGLYATDTGDFADKILYLADNPSVSKELGAKGKERIQKYYVWEKLEKDLLGLYEKLLK
jgi:glycosyltransferase involved in cell wall biosynthesis